MTLVKLALAGWIAGLLAYLLALGISLRRVDFQVGVGFTRLVPRDTPV
jgi:hypothetical protein